MTSKEDAQYCLKELQDTLGLDAKVIGYVEDPGSDEWGENYGFGLIIRAKSGTDFRLWISADPEGNGPGFVHVEAHS